MNDHDDLGSATEPSLQARFKRAVESRQNLQLSNIVINTGLDALHLRLSTKSILLVTLLIGFLIWGLTTLISLAVNRSFPAITPSALASFLTSFSFGIIKYLDYHLISSRSAIFPENLASKAMDNATIEAIIRWLNSFLSLATQIATSTVVGILGLASAIYIAEARSTQFKAGSYVLVFCCCFALGHGLYCTVLIPTLVRVLSRHRMRLFWLNPADTAWVQEASSFFTKLTVADALIFALAIAGLYLLKPWQASGTTWMALAWLLFGALCVSYIFLFPHYHLNKTIKRVKESELRKLQSKIGTYDPSKSKPSEYLEMLGNIKVYRDLVAAKESAIDIQNSFRVLGSVAILVASYFGPSLLRLLGITSP